MVYPLFPHTVLKAPSIRTLKVLEPYLTSPETERKLENLDVRVIERVGFVIGVSSDAQEEL